MALLQLYQIRSASYNPSGITNVLPGGAGVQTAGSSANPGISAPTLEAMYREVNDITAPTTLTAVAGATTAATPAPAGKLLVLDPVNGIYGANWKLNSVKFQALFAGSFGIVSAAGQASEAGVGVTSSSGNIANPGSKSLVAVEGPTQAFVNTTVTNTAISAGMALAADGAGNLTYAGASPAAGTVLASLMGGTVAAGISVPVLAQVYLGGY